MQLGKIRKEIICTLKDKELVSSKLFLVELLKISGGSLNDYAVAVENGLSLGVNDIVILVQGSAARLINNNKSVPVDCAVAAKVHDIFIDAKYL
jgi:ethanolamine utilization protein EutN